MNDYFQGNEFILGETKIDIFYICSLFGHEENEHLLNFDGLNY